MSKFEHLKERGIIKERNGLLIIESCNYTNYFRELPELENNYWLHCIPENHIKKGTYQCDLARIVKNGMDKMFGLKYDCVYYDEEVKKLYFICKVRSEVLLKVVSERTFYFENIHVTIKLNISNYIVNNPIQPYCWAVFEEDVHFPTFTPADLKRE